MLKKAHQKLQHQWMTGKLNIIAAARRMGYKKGALSKGVHKVRALLSEMGITIL